MTVTPALATCPRCGIKNTIFIRSDDDKDLVCRSTICREGAAPSITQASPSRRIFGRRR